LPLAVAAFVLSLIGLLVSIVALASLPMAVVARKRIRQSGGMLGGEGIAQAAFVISIIDLVFWVIALIYLSSGGHLR